MRLGITGQLSKTLCSTNPCESMIEIVRCQRSRKFPRCDRENSPPVGEPARAGGGVVAGA
jgi:hypothetical protein